ncbi:MAG: CocE/NonD family hydrolase [Ketobacteraceae bacterium]|nr:CocE/NonD family hydrolase [Ketobacteraceae bacterium]
MDNNRKAAVAVACALGASVATSTTMAAPVMSEDGRHLYDDHIFITTRLDPGDPDNPDQIAIPANIRIPISNDPTQTFPLIIFISSWTLNEYEYTNQAKKLASEGYAVLSYTTRGFGRAPGLVDTAGEKDVYDARQAITFALENYPVDESAIALAGISYGAGISLLTGFQDERVDAIVAMSGWGSLVESLWAGNTPNETWINVLVNTGNLLGDLDPVVEQNYNNMKRHEHIEETKAWGAIRGPLTYIEQVNSRQHKPALFVSNNLHDYLFQPNSMVELVSQYQGPWRSLFNFGTHGQGEGGGLAEPYGDNAPWKEATHWLDHYLKGVDNGIDRLKAVNTVVRSRSYRLPGITESFEGFPVAASDGHQVFYLGAGEAGFGTLSEQQDLGFASLTYDTTETVITAAALTGALVGSGHNYPLDRIDPHHSLAFMSEPLEEDMYIRGEINLRVWAEVQDKSQFFAYLMEYDQSLDKAIFIGHAPFTWHTSEQGPLPDGPVPLDLEFYWTAYDVDAGNQLLLVIDGRDGDYWRYADTPATNTLVFGPDQLGSIDIPTIPEPVPYYSVEDPEGVTTDPNSRGLGNNPSGNYGPGGGSLNPALLMWFVLLLAMYGLSGFRRFHRGQL